MIMQTNVKDMKQYYIKSKIVIISITEERNVGQNPRNTSN